MVSNKPFKLRAALYYHSFLTIAYTLPIVVQNLSRLEFPLSSALVLELASSSIYLSSLDTCSMRGDRFTPVFGFTEMAVWAPNRRLQAAVRGPDVVPRKVSLISEASAQARGSLQV